ncbi:methylglyoxal synthase [Aliifodinibius sp. S!AR15-10]|uniref:methylglyoxal synthase n=1 Tax=Aliifodinibius sp. S!AR15-10 TaxID=2950437 RepID=UPI00285D0EE2|nr:methylglyoxal synthase [Aliifodinibius sp. S!AR15-10]MDR8392751.1 methylglyoxal synthase [Aliifodinibius sp. S!AR15-10]
MSIKQTDPPIAHSSKRMGRKKNIALIAHDHRKSDLLDWAEFNSESLSKHNLFGTGTTGALISEKLDLKVHCFKSGPLGGDLQIGAAISENEIDMMIFFWDPLQAQPHDVDVKALLRIAVLNNIPIAQNRSSADFLISSPLMNETYDRYIVDYSKRFSKDINK